MTRTKVKRKRRAAKRNEAAPAVATKTVLVLRTCDAKMKSHKGFKWPTSGPVEAPDWKPTVACGNGLHGWLWGEGDGSLGNWAGDAKWLVVEVAESDIIDLAGKAKFPRGVVVHCGDRLSATEFVRQHGGIGRAIIGGTSTSGYRGTSTSGDYGTSTSGNYGTSTSGDGGTSTSGDGGTSTSGYYGTSTSGDRGTLCIRYWDEKAQRYRLAVGYVGEDGIKPNTKYRFGGGTFVEVVSGGTR